MFQKVYYKITNAEEKHYDFQYRDGLNRLKGKFNEDQEDPCGPGGLYFCDIKNILEFLDKGIYLREITLPNKDPEFKILKCDNKYRANMIILGKKYSLSDVSTFKMLIESGADLHANNCYSLKWSAYNGYLDIVKYLISNGANANVIDGYAMQWSTRKGHYEVVRYIQKLRASYDIKNIIYK